MGKAAASVAVLYSSDYGYSDRLSQTLARGITKAGAATEMVDVLSVDPQVGRPPLVVRDDELSHTMPSRACRLWADCFCYCGAHQLSCSVGVVELLVFGSHNLLDTESCKM